MKQISILIIAMSISLGASSQTKPSCTADCCKKVEKVKSTAFTCKLTTPELQERKATVLASLKKKVIEKKELKNGFVYKFENTKSIEDELNSFVKDEKECCDFLSFKITQSSDKKETLLEISGPEGAKDFITAELEI
jgi:hypothetical protein